MATYQIDWYWFNASGYGPHTIDINIPPSLVGAQVSLHGDTGSTTGAIAGIKGYRRRLSSGADEEHDFGQWLTWPPVVFDHVTSITLAVDAGKGQTAWLVARFDYWQ